MSENTLALASQDSVLTVIANAAKNPEVSVEKMERLFELQVQIMGKQAEADFSSALAEMQGELPVIKERGEIRINDRNKQKYALWEDINQQILPILKKHGFALSFRASFAEGSIIVTGVLSHRSGHSVTTDVKLPADDSGSKNKVQQVGSSLSYGKRYAAGMLLNITSCGEDDDGNAGVNDELLNEWLDAIKETKHKGELLKIGCDLKETVIAEQIMKRIRAAYSDRLNYFKKLEASL